MKKKLLFASALAFSFFSCMAQTVIFSQDFNSSTDLSDYIDGTNSTTTKFTNKNYGANAEVSVANNKLELIRNATATVKGGGITRTGLGTNSVLKISFSFSYSSQTPSIDNTVVFQIGDGFGAASSTPQADALVHSRVAFSGTANAGEFTLNNPSSISAPGTGADLSGTFSGTQNITMYVNNGNGSTTYSAPDGSTSSVGQDTYDLYVGNTLVLNERPALTASLSNLSCIGINGRNVNDFSSSCAFDDIVVTSVPFVLPVRVTKFEGLAENDFINLNWETASEKNNNYYEITRSNNRKDFVRIGVVKGAGDSEQLTKYTFIDRSPKAGTNYYQLNQVDYDGTENVCSTIAVKSLVKGSGLQVLSVNQSTVQISVYAESECLGNFIITDLTGRRLLSKSLELAKGYNTFNIPVQLNVDGVLVGSLTLGNQNFAVKFAKN